MKRAVIVVAAVCLIIGSHLRAQNTYEAIHTFGVNPGDGVEPLGRLLQASDGNFYGVTYGGGDHGLGTVYRMTPDGAVTTLVSFDGTNGENPSGGLVQASDTHIYGTTQMGGGLGWGTAFRITLGGVFETVADFDFDTTGAQPLGGLIEATDGFMYGTTPFGGPTFLGTVFRLTQAGELSVVAAFDGLNGDLPTSGVVQGPDGDLYGATEFGGEFAFGAIFRLSMLDGTLTSIKSFDGTDGNTPTARPLLASDGYLYGTTLFGGGGDLGAIYRVALDGSEFEVVASFDGSNGALPFEEGLVEGADGALYGTAGNGGNGDFGVVYRLDGNTIVPIHLFDGVTGLVSNNTLIKSSEGALYGTTLGPEGGTIFRIAFEDESGATLELAPSMAVYGGATSLSATLSKPSGPVVGVEIAFSLNGVALGAAMTDDAGIATLAHVSVAGLDAGSYPGAVHASAASPASEAIGDLTIVRAVPSVSVVGGTFTYDGEPHAASATVTGVTGEDLGAAVITYNGSESAPVEPNTYAVFAAYAGSINYQAASGTAVLTILPPAPGVTGLIAAYGFNEGGGDVAADSSGRGHHGVIKGADYVEGRFGRALRFDGKNDWVTIADDADLDLRNALTIEAWVKPNALSGWRTVVIKERNEWSQAYALYGSEDVPRPSGYVNIGGDYKGVMGPGLPLNAWTHVAVTYSGSMLRLYVNGVEVNRRSVSGKLVTGNAPLRIGGNSIWGEYFDGLIDEVRIYGSAISPADIRRDMSMPIARETEPPAVSIVSPLDGGVLSGKPMITVAASDNVAVASVEIQVDGAVVGGSLAGAPYTARLDAANGVHTIRAVARDTAGNVATSDPITIRIANRRVADYRFDEGSGRAVEDSSGRGNHGTTTASGVTRVVDAQRGKVLQFNGAGGMVSVPDSDSLDLTTGITLEAWVKPSAISGWRTVVLKEGNDTEQYSIYANEDVAAPAGYVYIDSEYRAVHGNRRLTLNAWTHLAVTYDGTTMRMFVNGEEKDSRAQTGAAMISGGQLSIGGNTIWGEWFRGQMDDVRIYDVAVGEAQIKADMNGVEPE